MKEVEREAAWLVAMSAQERLWDSLFAVSTLIAAPRKRNDPSAPVPPASLLLFSFRRKVPLSSGSLPSFPFAMRRELIERAAPLYQEAPLAQKGLLLDQVVAMTGYARKYAIGLLHQAPQGRRTILRPRLPRYGSEVRQLHELYRALRLYVNCFQPSMKLLSKQVEEGKVRRVYDPAKTPLQRLLLSGILPEATQHQLSEVAQALDTIRLLHQVEQLQPAVWRWVVTPFPPILTSSMASLVPFCVERCLPEGSLPEEQGTAALSVHSWLQDAPQPEREMPDWSRTMRDPFEGKWDLICSLVLTHPEWSGRMLLQELQRLFPGSY